MNREEIRQEYLSLMLKVGEKSHLKHKLQKQVEQLEVVNREIEQFLDKATELEALFKTLPQEVTSETPKE